MKTAAALLTAGIVGVAVMPALADTYYFRTKPPVTAPGRGAPAPVVTGAPLSAEQGTAVNVAFAASNILGSATWSTEGTLPAGLSLSASTGRLSGTPTAVGTGSFAVKVTDSRDGAAASYVVSFTVAAKRVLLWREIPDGAFETDSDRSQFGQCSAMIGKSCPTDQHLTYCDAQSGKFVRSLRCM